MLRRIISLFLSILLLLPSCAALEEQPFRQFVTVITLIASADDSCEAAFMGQEIETGKALVECQKTKAEKIIKDYRFEHGDIIRATYDEAQEIAEKYDDGTLPLKSYDTERNKLYQERQIKLEQRLEELRAQQAQAKVVMQGITVGALVGATAYYAAQNSNGWGGYTPTQTCCKYCSIGKPCGNTCIAKTKQCHVGPGCACWG